jgi:hypothetical protein
LAVSISPDGLIAGTYTDTDGVNHGFLRSARGIFMDFDVPGAGTDGGQGTFCMGSNAAGTSTGSYVDAYDASHGFVLTLEPESAE